jgi:hypothetical protein
MGRPAKSTRSRTSPTIEPRWSCGQWLGWSARRLGRKGGGRGEVFDRLGYDLVAVHAGAECYPMLRSVVTVYEFQGPLSESERDLTPNPEVGCIDATECDRCLLDMSECRKDERVRTPSSSRARASWRCRGDE